MKILIIIEDLKYETAGKGGILGFLKMGLGDESC